MKYTLPPLPIKADALEPYIDAGTMEIHHGKHHNGYVTKLNAALEKAPSISDTPLETLLTDVDGLPEEVRTAVRNNGGGHYNHSLFWSVLTPEQGSPGETLSNRITKDFGSLDAMKKEFNSAAVGRFGSGWAWLGVNKEDSLVILSTPNQDTPLQQGIRPILGLDVWEHAYYLKYQNKRADYIDAFWNIVNWTNVEKYLKEGFHL